MVRLCDDRDILKIEPVLFGELHFSNQVIAAGTAGELTGTTFEASGANFVSDGVEAGECVYLRSADGVLDGVYEIAAVDSATQLCVSVLRVDSEADPIAPPTVSDVSYRISTFKPQIADVSLRLMEYLWIRPGQVIRDISVDEILDSDEVRQLCAIGVTATAYRTLASGADGENFKGKWQKYEEMFGKGMERCRVAIDKDGDGVVDSIRFGGCGRLIRD
ncbi:MAG: hypothetical protein ABSB25_01270 [Sedimentisphaerales bacterium]|jgi:hypothetical protein